MGRLFEKYRLIKTATANIGFAKGGLTFFVETFVLKQTFVLV